MFKLVPLLLPLCFHNYSEFWYSRKNKLVRDATSHNAAEIHDMCAVLCCASWQLHRGTFNSWILNLMCTWYVCVICFLYSAWRVLCWWFSEECLQMQLIILFHGKMHITFPWRRHSILLFIRKFWTFLIVKRQLDLDIILNNCFWLDSWNSYLCS